MFVGHLFNSRFLFSISRQQFIIQARWTILLLASQDHSISTTTPLLFIVKCSRLWFGWDISFEYHLECFLSGKSESAFAYFVFLFKSI